MSLEIRTPTATLDISSLCDGAMPMDRGRSYGVRLGRAPESDVWQTFGDRRENPSTIQWRLTLKSDTTRAWQRNAINTIQAFCAAAISVYNIPDQREDGVTWGEVTQESPTEDSYVLQLTFYPVGPVSISTITPDTGVY
ncbi:hypothetical protein ACFFLM_19105 [Deinococcus oregonensis]|uniref:Tail terminator n=1 Tax=Deinococcus oregonensis TaxID=1805970 RepID=A0ABV6B556_9DEIO